ncbi:biofilm formation regulator BacA [Teredinibacter franksiae]|uniref:biofilm formation regulator BacA n=1 Tax=Teredinibacter franksiae TaxID=2761453 RepID=UPI0016259E83|nr:YjfI family protein [Teredinibacter franksiae]
MKAKSSAHYQREYRQRLRDMGLVKKEVWILAENAKQLSAVEKMLRQITPKPIMETGDEPMTTPLKSWTTEGLYQALKQEELFTGKNAGIELIDGAEQALHMVMYEYGDLPLFLTVAGEQIIVEAVLWSTEEVENTAKFNQTVLRTHKYFPLSTISLDTLPDGKDYYQMFGALSATSILPNIIFEIETLAANVIHATEAYSNLLTTSAELQG